MTNTQITIIQALQATPDAVGDHADALKAVIKASDAGNVQLLLAFAPKVGGTFLRSVLIDLGAAKNFNAALCRGSYATGNQERDIYYPSLLAQHIKTFPDKRKGFHVKHLHLQANDPNRRLIELFNIRTVVMKRNLLDTLKSFFDHGERVGESRLEDCVLRLGNVYPNLDFDEKKKAIIAFALPWYLQFFLSWREYTDYCESEGLRKPFWTSYNDLAENAVQLVLDLTEALDLGMTVRKYDVEMALKKALRQKEALRFNKGINGRGLEFFNQEEQDEINKLIDIVGRDAIEAEGLLGYP